ncbi:myosin-VIIa [Aplysia californica]|uniref:Myosin-VIIa n=1 Tax=Aplysia californica TaxID=6500 RepID=A0ABM1A5L4_APLCA|nr:myosin-VIIa [Aplysia californica]
MGDMPDADTGDTLVLAGESMPMVTKIKLGFTNKYTKKDIEDAHRRYSELFKDPVSSDSRSIPFLTGPEESMLDKVQLICAMGIYKPSLRDELYCQLCKQLSNNPSRNSTVRGWVLMILFTGSFSPTEKFAPVLSNFICDGPVEFTEKADRTLRRTCSVGTRGYPPSWLEFQSAKNGKPLLVPITLMNGNRLLCEVDSATTVVELIRNISERLGLADTIGYSLYVSLQSKISCLGNGQHRVLDAISECEQHTKLMGIRESNALWRLFFRRELFTPWYVPGWDPVCTDLMYHQVKRGLTLGEYRLEKEEALVELLTKFYYVENPQDPDFSKLSSFITDFVPQNELEKKPDNYYDEKAKAMFKTLKLGVGRSMEAQVKATIVKYAMERFYILFSRYYDISKFSGGSLQLQDVVLALNNKGLFIIDQQDSLKMQIPFAEIVNTSKARHSLTLVLASMDEYTLSSPSAEVLYLQITTFLEELKKKSMCAVAVQALTPLDGPDGMNIVKGDVLQLRQSVGDLKGSEMVSVTSQRTGKASEVPRNVLYIVPVAGDLKAEILATLTSQIRKDASRFVKDDRQPRQTLQQYAKSYFRPTTESTVTKLLSKASFKRDKNDALWSYSKDGLKKPLLKRTCHRDDTRKLACHAFACLQSYMMNLVINDEMANYNLCKDWILEPARRNKYMRDEIYCQVIKQVTNNPDKNNEDRGWVLLTLLTSLCQPSNELIDHLLTIIRSAQHPLAHRCEVNLKLNRKKGACRLYPSHVQEHEMVLHQQPNVRVQVCLPNQSVQTIEVTSGTRIFDIKKEIAARLKLRTFSEYSLFFTANDKVHCLSDRLYYFDCLTHSEIFWFNSKRRNSLSPGKTGQTPLLVMLKKIWVNGQPGVDPMADQTFHFPQESPNYLRGYHKVSDSVVPKLAALSYRAQHGKDESKLTDLSKIEQIILPKGFLEGKDAKAIQEEIQQEYSSQNMNSEQAKTAFLQILSKISTYGSVFFEVKQRHMTTLPKSCLVAINYSGVHLINGTTKDVIKSYEFQSIPNWAYDESSFTFIVTEGIATAKLLVETHVGHNIDDLLMSYVAWLMNYQMRKKHGYLGEMSGESIC